MSCLLNFTHGDRRFRSLTRRILVSFVIAASCGFTATAADSKPNVVFILADDLGWSDTTLFQTTKFYHTPNIERLAARDDVHTCLFVQPAVLSNASECADGT